jgi:alcohol dehydrogenase
MKALRFDGRVGLVDAPEPLLAPGEALIRSLRVGIASPDLAAAAGRLAFRGTLGHEFVGVVERVMPAADSPRSAADATRKLEGRRVVGSIHAPCGKCELCRGGLAAHCQARTVLGLHGRDGCFAERFSLPLTNLVEVPKAVDDDTAVFANAAAAALHAAQIIRIVGKPYVTVLGDGLMGLLAAQVMTRLNASVRLLGKHPEKFGLCEKWGIKHRHISEVGRRMDQDVVIDCTGVPAGLTLAMQLVRPRGKIILKTSPAPVPAAGVVAGAAGADLSPAVCNELEIIGAGSGKIGDGLAALAKGEVEVRSLISKRFRLGDGVAAMEAARGAVKVLMEM